MLLKLRVQNKGHRKPLSRPEALQENPAEACFWNSQDGSGTLPQRWLTMQGISILHSATVHGIMEFWLSSLSTFTTRLIW